MKTGKRILSVLLSFMLALGVCAAAPFTASADSGTLIIGNQSINLDRNGTYFDGKAVYDAAEKTLTFNDLDLTLEERYNIYGHDFDITFKGSATFTCSGRITSINSKNTKLRFDGDFNFYETGTESAVNFEGEIIIEGGRVNIVSPSGNGIETWDGTLTVNDGILSVNANDDCIKIGGYMVVNGGAVIVKGSGYECLTVHTTLYYGEGGTLTVNGGYICLEDKSHALGIFEDSLILNNGETVANGRYTAAKVLIRIPGNLAGDGTEEIPYYIADYSDLKLFASKVNGGETAACAKVMNQGNIECKNENETEYARDWEPVCTAYNQTFNGTFDGSGCGIVGLGTPEDYSGDYAGLFGQIGENGVVKNLLVENCSFSGNYAGAVAAVNEGEISQCGASGSVTGVISAGGVVGFNSGTVEKCYNVGSVKTEKYLEDDLFASIKNYAGGVVGFMNDGLLANCYNTGDVVLESTAVCEKHALVEAYNGGVTGCANQGIVKNCYSCGSTELNATATSAVMSETISYEGGVAGNIRTGAVENCYYDNERSAFAGAVNGADDEENNVRGLATAEMTGENAIGPGSMNFVFDEGETSPWQTRANGPKDGVIYTLYPHLKGFLFDSATWNMNYWPPKLTELIDYAINISASPAGGGIVTGGGIFNWNNRATVTAEANAGYSFINWTENGEVLTEETGYSFYVYTDHSLVANFEALTYTATFVNEDGTELETRDYTVETTELDEPAVPEKQGYTGKWEAYEYTPGGIIVKPEYTAIEYTAKFVDENGETVKEVPYTVETESIKDKEPAVPEKQGYTGEWEDYTLDIGGITVKPEYTAIEYTATFVDENGETVGEVPYTVETQSITEPAVPEKQGYAGEWEEYELAIGGITVRPVYTNISSIEIEGYTDSSESGYKEDRTFTVNAENLPEGAEIHWFVNGEDVGTGESYTVEDPIDDYTVQAKVIDKDGNTIAESEEQTVKVRNGFFDRLKAFFAELIEKILGKAIAELLTSIC